RRAERQSRLVRLASQDLLIVCNKRLLLGFRRIIVIVMVVVMMMEMVVSTRRRLTAMVVSSVLVGLQKCDKAHEKDAEHKGHGKRDAVVPVELYLRQKVRKRDE